MNYNPKHVKFNKDGEIEGDRLDEHKYKACEARKHREQSDIRVVNLSEEDTKALLKVGAITIDKPKNSTDKRSDKEVIVSRKAKLRHNKDKKACDSSWVVESVEPPVEPTFEIVEDKKEGSVTLLENGKPAIAAYKYDVKDAEYAKWAER